MKTVRFIMAIHNHQPVGNLDRIFQKACRQAYHPFLDVLDDFPAIRAVLHFSGPLHEWLSANDPALLDRLKHGIHAGRFELLAGGFGEPILTMLSRRDIDGQIKLYRRLLQDRYETRIRGVWLPERVWEQQLVTPLAAAGVEYTVLDDFHFRCAGLRDNDLPGYYLTEDQGSLLRLFNGSEFLRYAIPFADPQKSIDYLRRHATEDGTNIIVYADDGEKFGLWPETHKHVYRDGWLRRFLTALNENRDWIHFCTFADAVDELQPRGRVYLPDASYREMAEWVLPTPARIELEEAMKDLDGTAELARLKPFVRGGFWRNFKTKYVEAHRMYARMMEVSGLLAGRAAARKIEEATRELYRGQCNCAYWHGVFGGLYMPFLRFAAYQSLLRAEKLVARRQTRPRREIRDFDLDGRPEVKLSNTHLNCYLKPHRGGVLYELDDRERACNLTAVMTRRREAYHRRLLEAVRQTDQPLDPGRHAVSIHNVVRCKEPNLHKLLHYDVAVRDSLIDHFYPTNAAPHALRENRIKDLGDFVGAEYACKAPRSKASSVTLSRRGTAGPAGRTVPVEIAKRLSLAQAGLLKIRYVLGFPEGAPPDALFAVEFNFGLMAGDAPDRNYFCAQGRNLNNLSTILQREPDSALGIVDEWLGLEIWLHADPHAAFWTYPVETVNDSEEGFERIYQGSAIIANWPLSARSGEEHLFNLALEVRHR